MKYYRIANQFDLDYNTSRVELLGEFEVFAETDKQIAKRKIEEYINTRRRNSPAGKWEYIEGAQRVIDWLDSKGDEDEPKIEDSFCWKHNIYYNNIDNVCPRCDAHPPQE